MKILTVQSWQDLQNKIVTPQANIFVPLIQADDKSIAEIIAMLQTATEKNLRGRFGEKLVNVGAQTINFVGKLFDKDVGLGKTVRDLNQIYTTKLDYLEDMSRVELNELLRAELIRRCGEEPYTCKINKRGEFVPKIKYTDEELSCLIVEKTYSGEKTSMNTLEKADYIAKTSGAQRDINFNDLNVVTDTFSLQRRILAKFIAIARSFNGDKSFALMNDLPVRRSNETYTNEEVAPRIHQAIREAQREIAIVCPWMNYRVVKNNFLEEFRAAVARGVTIRICYGITGEYRDDRDETRAEWSDKTAAMLLRELDNDYLEIFRGNTHDKFVFCDDEYYFEGGFNLLSFDGDYSRSNQRREHMTLSYDKVALRRYKANYFD